MYSCAWNDTRKQWKLIERTNSMYDDKFNSIFENDCCVWHLGIGVWWLRRVCVCVYVMCATCVIGIDIFAATLIEIYSSIHSSCISDYNCLERQLKYTINFAWIWNCFWSSFNSNTSSSWCIILDALPVSLCSMLSWAHPPRLLSKSNVCYDVWKSVVSPSVIMWI